MANMFDQFDAAPEQNTQGAQAPKAAPNMFDQFDGVKAQEPEEEPSWYQDLYHTAGAAFVNSFAADAKAIELLGGGEGAKYVGDQLGGVADGIHSNVSKAGQAAEQKLFISDQEGEIFGEAVTDPRAYLQLLGGAIGSMGAIIASGGITKIAASGAIRGAAKLMGKEALKKGGKGEAIVGAASYAAAEGLMVGGSAAQNIEQAIADMPDETLKDAPLFQESYWELRDNGVDHEDAFDQARAATAKVLATEGMLVAGTASVFLGAVGGKFIDDALTGRLAGTRMQRAGKGLGTEAGTEALQGGAEQMAVNAAVQQADPNVELMDGVANAAVAEGIGGGMAGGALGYLSKNPKDIESDEIESQSSEAVDAELDTIERSLADQDVAQQSSMQGQIITPVGFEPMPAQEQEVDAPEEDELTAQIAHYQKLTTAKLQREAEEDAAWKQRDTVNSHGIEIDGEIHRENEADQAWKDKEKSDRAIDQKLQNKQPDEDEYLADSSKMPLAYVAKKIGAKEKAQALREKLELSKGKPANGSMAAALQRAMDESGVSKYDIGQQTKFEKGSAFVRPKAKAPTKFDTIDGDNDTLLSAVRKLGGWSSEEAYSDGVDKADLMGFRGVHRPVHSKGRTLDDLRESLVEQGFIKPDMDKEALRDLVGRAIAGEEVYSHHAQGRKDMLAYEDSLREQAQAEDEMAIAELADRDSEHNDESDPKYAVLSGAVADAIEAGVTNTEIAKVIAGEDFASKMGGLHGLIGKYRSEQRGQQANIGGSQKDSGRADGQEKGGLDFGTRYSDEDAEAFWAGIDPEQKFELDTYTEADIAAKEKREQDETAKAKADQKAQVDRETEHFQLGSPSATVSGSNDSLQKGQAGDMFAPTRDQTPKPTKLTPQANRQTSEASAISDEIENAAHEAATSPKNNLPEPTEAQKDAGNYKKGHVNFQGLDVAIENPAGSTRSGTSPDGKSWSNTMKHHYGYIKKTEGADGDHVDIFIGNSPESEKVFIVDQMNADGSFDEHKVLLGFKDKALAITGYKSAYDKGWKVGKVTSMTMGEFKQWLDTGDTKNPIADSETISDKDFEFLLNDISETEGLGVIRKDAMYKRASDLLAGNTSAANLVEHTKWAKDWISEAKAKLSESAKVTAEKVKADKVNADKLKASKDADRQKLLAGDTSGVGNDKYAEWIKTLSQKERSDLFGDESNAAVANSAYMAWVAKNDADNTEAEAIQKFEPNWDSFVKFFEDIEAGKGTIEDVQSGFDVIIKQADDMKASIKKFTIPELKQMVGWLARSDYKKGDYVDKLYERARNRFLLMKPVPSFTYSFGEKAEAVEARHAGKLKAIVDELTAGDLAEYQSHIAQAKADRAAKNKAKAEGMEDPKTLDDFLNLLRSKMGEGMTLKEARFTMSPELRAKYDDLAASSSRENRNYKKEEKATHVAVAGQKVSGNIIETKHTKKGHDLFVVQLEERVSKEDYQTLNAGAKKLGGYYSSYRGAGAVVGFQFPSMEAAEAFNKLAGGDSSAATEQVGERRDAFADDKNQSASERLSEMASRLGERADEALNADRKSNTHRRAAIAARATAAAEADKALAKTMVNLAKAIESGEAKLLDRVRQKVQVEFLLSQLNLAQNQERSEKYPSYSEQERHKGEPATGETADYADWPTYTAERADLARLGRELESIGGTKALGAKLLKVADDISDAYLKFAKENLNKVTRFTLASGELATFRKKTDALNAIYHSKLSGRATVLNVSKGEWVIIMSPQLAMETGAWEGEGRKRISLSSDFGREIVEKVKTLNRKTERVSLPWQLTNAHEKLGRFSKMGIETAAEMRAALREFIGLREAPKAPDKIKEMERAMIGRRKDGLDFFPTSSAVVESMLDAAELTDGMSVLEPSAGMGHIAEQVRSAGVEPDVVELSPDRRELLEAKGFNVVGNDFKELGTDKRYDRILMNPPFSDRRDAEHVQHAYTLLNNGGRIVAVVGEGVFFGSDKKATAFRDWLDSLGATSEQLPENSFMDAALPVNTSVNARLVVIDKPMDAKESSSAEGVAYSLVVDSGKPVKTGMDVQAVKTAVSELSKSVGVPIEVVATVKDLPKAIQDVVRRDGFEGSIKGLYHTDTGKAYLVASSLNTPEAAAKTYLHEVVGHKGIRATLGKKLNIALVQLYRDMPADVKAALEKKYAGQLKAFNEHTKKLIVADEYAAHLAESDPKNSLIQSIISTIRKWLRQVFPSIQWTEADAIELLAEGKRALSKQSKQTIETGDVEALASLKDRKRIASDLVRMYEKFYDNDSNVVYTKSDSKDLGSILKTMGLDDRTHSVEDKARVTVDPKKVKAEVKALRVKDANGVLQMTIYDIDSEAPFIEIGNENGERAKQGAGLYQAAFAWAHNNGKRIKPDPRGITYINRIRRSEALIASAVKYGTTKHLEPHPDQFIGMVKDAWFKYGDNPNNYIGDNPDLQAELERLKSDLWTDEAIAKNDEELEQIRAANINNMIVANAALVLRRSPDLARFRIDSKGVLHERMEKDDTVQYQDAAEAKERLKDYASENNAQNGVGASTAYRGIVARSTLSESELREGEGAPFTGAKFTQPKNGGRLPQDATRRLLPDALLDRLAQSDSAAGQFYSTHDEQTEERLALLGLGRKQKTGLAAHIERLKNTNFKEAYEGGKTRAYEGVFDGLAGINRAEIAVGKGAKETGDYANSGYVGARLATGIADLMSAILNYGAPKWQDGVIQHIPDTKGLLEIFGELGGDLNHWLGWMGGMRGEELMSEGRENNLDQADIDALKALRTPELAAKFDAAKTEYAKLNQAMLDLAQDSGLIDPTVRQKFQSEWYVPFYRQDVDGEGLMAPRTKRGLSHQSSGIKALKGGATATNDLLENILTNWMKLADSSMKNMALVKTVDNLKDTEYLSTETLKYTQAIVPKAEINKRVKEDREARSVVADMLGMPKDATKQEVLDELTKLDSAGFQKLWAITAPTDPAVIRVQRAGKNEYYKVNDPALLRGLVHLAGNDNNGALMKGARFFKRLLTTGVTASPDFMIRNLVRDAAHAWAINKDGFVFGKDSVKGIIQAFKQDPDYRELMFANASFQGGYVHGTDPGATAQVIRRMLERKGLTPAEINEHENSIITIGSAGWSKAKKGWQLYREAGDKLENSNRLATFKAAKKAGKSLAQAVFESKDLMDYSLRGNFAAMNAFTDVVPFLNARLQGLSKLARAAEVKGELLKPWTWRTDPQLGMAVGKIALFSAALALWNDDDERYQQLPDWEKDAYWHILTQDGHFRIPKPFEIGIIAGTIPERAMHTWILNNQPDDKMLWSLKHGLLDTLSFNPVPQAVLPIAELWANKSFHFGSPIESLRDQSKLPEARYNAHTSDFAVWLGKLSGQSPKRLEHLWTAYTGTMGAYALGALDALVALSQGKPNKGELLPTDIPVLKSFYRGESPAYSTQYSTDLYDRLKEVNQLAATMRDLRGEDRKAFVDEHRDKLKNQKRLSNASEQLNRLRKAMDKVIAEDLPAKAKQLKIEAIQKKMNSLSEKIAKGTEDDF